ncbi:MAG: DoxX family protein [Alphaproteobacteria bacterium]
MAETSSYPFGAAGRAYGAFARMAENIIPYWLIALAARLGVGMVFWKSGQTKLIGDFEIAPAIYLQFQNEFFPNWNEGLVDGMVVLTTVMENVCGLLLMVGVLTRLNALALLGMTAVIQFLVWTDWSKLADFANPFQAWDTHLFWAAALLLIIARGPGAVSVDHVVGRLFGRRQG